MPTEQNKIYTVLKEICRKKGQRFERGQLCEKNNKKSGLMSYISCNSTRADQTE